MPNEKPFKLDMSFNEALTRFARVKPGEARDVSASKDGLDVKPKQGELELIHCQTADCSADFTLDPSNETVWAPQQQIADVFGISTSTVRGHLTNIFKEGELEESAVARECRATGSDSKFYKKLHYSLDAILSVGYRVSSKRATAFRRWATQTLKDYIVQGFALDEQRLKDDPKALRELAARVRALRADEKNVYASVRDAYAFGSVDYEPNSQAAKSFFAKLQDKFLYAITGTTASELILSRANHDQPNMGLQTMQGERPQIADVTIGKTYLVPDELYGLHILCEQFLLFIESRALRGQPLTMEEMSRKFDDLLTLQGHQVFAQYKDYLAEKAKSHAIAELKRYRSRLPDQRKAQAG